MPNYTYTCENHGEFTLNQSMHDNHDFAVCPDCNQKSNRVFIPFGTTKIDSKLKKRIEAGQTPRLVSQKQLPNKQKQPSNKRPWMV